MATNHLKDPDATLDWIFDWSQWLAPTENITASVMVVSPGINLESSGFSASTATAWVSGGTEGRVYQVSNKITTNQGRIDERSITIRVTNR
ncbi:phage fiber-tail adaptor protein [Streptomyces microflavus]|uniref:phage fiber-tail adaptor protein n=1 Tax=Streptomyces microflavus TaxID=1919 RepID=UPI0036D1A336